MKKNKMMRIASILLVAVLISTCAISGTFAKYVTKGEGTDTARVAKWGITITPGEGTFGAAYKNVANGNTVSTTYSATTDSVKSADDANVIAPGTKGSVASFTLTGKPEVDFNVTYAVAIEKTGWTVGQEDYFPIVFKVNGETVEDVVASVAALSKDYKAGTDLSTADVLDITWEWPFYVSDANDVKDTALGDAATAATLKITVTATVTQID